MDRSECLESGSKHAALFDSITYSHPRQWTDVATPEFGGDHGIAHAIGRPQPEFLVGIVENIDCTGFRA